MDIRNACRQEFIIGISTALYEWSRYDYGVANNERLASSLGILKLLASRVSVAEWLRSPPLDQQVENLGS